ncbi:acetylserotonin O-methyltransferase-like [Cornus florida]|uniref:acetylserotonin O-methyltransferase-like n=1 Tax=Cornus florida TaxID=4283 RepID=UPI0028980DA7|nr:acetylserotonin O-methyltransferase-like [Cornus florida]
MEGEGRREITSREEEEAQAQVNIWKYMFGFVDVAVVKCATELGIADVLESHGGPMTISELSSALGCPSPSALYRVMRFLVHQRVFKEDSSSQGIIGYAQTPLSRLLMRHGQNSLADLLLLGSSPAVVESWHSLTARVLSIDTSAFELAHGEDIWSYAATNPAQMKLIDDGMACDARVVVPAVIEGCSELFGGLNVLVDVGGGNGTTLSELVKAFPWIQGINFDLPRVVSAAPNRVGIEHVGGDMFDKVPKADAAILMWVLHDWGDEECIQILKKCREAIPEDKGKVIIVEAVIEEGEGDKLKYVRLMLDMVMMAQTKTGKERTLKEWAYILGEAGFSRYTVNRIQAVQSVIEAYP